MFTRIVVSVAILITLFVSPIFSQSDQKVDDRIVVSKSDIPPEILKQIEEKQRMENTTSTVSKYVGLGKEIGTAINEGLMAVTKTASEFAETKIGKLTVFLIAYEVIGTDVIQFFIGMFLLLVGTPLFVWSYWRNCLTRRVLESETKDGDKRYHMHEGDSDEKVFHVIFFFVFIIIVVLVTFL